MIIISRQSRRERPRVIPWPVIANLSQNTGVMSALPWLKVTYADSNAETNSFCIQCISCSKYDCLKCGQIHLGLGNTLFSCLNCKSKFKFPEPIGIIPLLYDFNNFIYYHGNMVRDSNVRLGFLEYCSVQEIDKIPSIHFNTVLALMYDTSIDLFNVELSNSRYECVRDRINLKRCRLVLNLKNFDGFGINIGTEIILFRLEHVNLQQLWIKSISSKLAKLDRVNKKQESKQDLKKRTNENLKDSSLVSSESTNVEDFTTIPRADQTDIFSPLVAKLFESFPELHASKPFDKPDVDYNDSTSVESKRSGSLKKSAKLTDKTKATNVNILDKLDEYFQFKKQQ
eukprot:NODE_144_length_17694_cov_0.489741.p5 type:complete len:342 gc:universal NODE_144_length_17694_cov_0.489741:8381-7356(-)